MISFLIKGFFGFFLLACLYAPKQYKDEVKKRMHPRYVWHVFLDRVYYFNPDKIVMSGNAKEKRVLLPGRYYDIVCEGNSKLTLLITDLQYDVQKTYLIKKIKANGSSKVILTSGTNEVGTQSIRINQIDLAELAVFDYSAFNSVTILKQFLSGNSAIVYGSL
jgi:hypothetical protein